MTVNQSRDIRVDIINSSDFRLPGGTSHSIGQEVLAQSQAGYRTGLLHIDSALIRRPVSWSSPILDVLDSPGVMVLSSARSVRASLLILRHPTVFSDATRLPSNVSADRIVVVANHAASDADGQLNYEVDLVDKNVRTVFGTAPVWAPIGPVVRSSLIEQGASVDISQDDWLNVIALDGDESSRKGLLGDIPIIGRHSRPQASKWPSRPREIRQAYPLTRDYRVRILGGAEAAQKVLGKVPSRWEVIPFGGMDPKRFLKTIDFWVYFHHENTREAYGRAIVEALASGAVVILPEYLEETYGNAALYGRPSDVQAIVDEYASDTEAFRRQSLRGQEFARRLSPVLHLDRIQRIGLPQPAGGGSLRRTRRPFNLGGERRRALFVTSNGAGMGHLTRLLAVASRLPSDVKPIFASLSTGVSVVESYKMPFEYIPSSGAMRMDASAWNRYFTARLGEVLDIYMPEVLIFDGTVPYAGLLNAARSRGLKLVWMRRAMWKREIVGRQLAKASSFELIIEPGEEAGAYDEGATTRMQDAHKVAPITLLGEDEMLDRRAARKELGYGDENVALVTLGAGNINDISSLQTRVLRWFSESLPEWRVVVTKPPISDGSAIPDIDILQIYPLARVAKAFDVAISAAGYNSFHEWISGGLPTLWIPNMNTMTDDQAGRARWAHDQGIGLALLDEEDHAALEAALSELTEPGWREGAKARLRGVGSVNGAKEAAERIAEIARRAPRWYR